MECTGGADAVVAKARTYAEAGDLRFAAILLNHVVFADASHRAARAEPAGVYRRLGHGAENGPWRNFHLMGAKELEEGAGTLALDSASPEMAMALTVEQLIDSLAVRVDGPRAWDMELVIDPVVTDGSATAPVRHRLTLHNGALTPRTAGPGAGSWAPAGLPLTLSKPQPLSVLAGEGPAGIEQTVTRPSSVSSSPYSRNRTGRSRS
ncbi:alkyl sulfatase dimerization domain-containing protein [Streptomyces bacillaris]|uniref:alkyl sulfatase dimerization domain-containing protein n=1 Tax=Streptomyces bacillaris TaxID=68179 RepID=UPI00367AD6CC